MTWHYSGYIRIHFNRKEEAPLLASITNHTHSWEVLATFVRIEGVSLHSMSNLENARPGIDPVWWLEGKANVTLDDNGVAAVTKYEKPAGVMSGLAIDMLRERSDEDKAAQSAGFVTAMTYGKGQRFTAEGLEGYIPVDKKRKTRKKTTKRRVR